jgi:hypothetical protein
MNQSMQSQKFDFGQKAQQRPTERSGHGPLKSYRIGAMSVSIWENEGLGNDGQVSAYKTVSFERRYKDKSGEWKSSNSLRVNDLPKATLLLSKAYEYLLLTADDNDEA